MQYSYIDSIINSKNSNLVTYAVAVIHFAALIILWNNTAKMAKNPAASKYYSSNVAASVFVVAPLIMLLIISIYVYLFPNFQYLGITANYFIIGIFISAFLVMIGYILLLTNTAKMQDDGSVSEFYYSNVASSVLISIGILIQIISKQF
jgi:hypothetical protein